MSGTLNKVMLIGHLGDEVKMHHFESGGCIGRFPMATTETYTNKQTNEKVSNTEWHNVVVKNKGAEICEKYLSKGDKVYVEGRIKTRKWQDKDGNDRYSTEIHCTEFKFLNNKSDSNGSSAEPQQQQSTSQPQSAGDQFLNMPPKEEDHDDLPF